VRAYLNKPMAELAAQLRAGLGRLRKGYVDAAEALLEVVDPSGEYPYEFIVYKLTGFRPKRSRAISVAMEGKSLRADLMRLMLDLCDSFDLRAESCSGKVYDVASLARLMRVSTKTIQRWRRMGLPARRLVFADGERRLAFLESSLRRFALNRHRRILRSAHFSHMTDAERQDVIRRARRMARFTRCSLNDIAKQLAADTGRAVETIRYTIRKHDVANPDRAVCPYLSAPLDEQAKSAVYQCFLRGVPAPALAQRYRRTRGSIYRVINEMRAKHLVERPIAYVHNPQFDLPNADETILSEAAAGADEPFNPKGELASLAKKPDDLPPYLASLYGVPLLGPRRERDLFRRYNYLKCLADRLRRRISVKSVRTPQLKRIEKLLLQANLAKNEIVRANLRLVVSIAKKHMGGPQGLFELISDGNVSLLKAVEKFDYARGNRFSTYASWAIMRNFARSVPKEKHQLDRFVTGQDEALNIAAAMRSYDPDEVNLPELRESIESLLAQLSPRERTILTDHYGLDQAQPARTLDQLGQHLGLSKERIRQIEIQALKKLRRIVKSEAASA